MYDWQGWVKRVLKLQAEWNEFYLVNAFVIVLGISQGHSVLITGFQERAAGRS